MQLLLSNSSSIITMGNKVKVLNNGQVTFEAIIEALSVAKHFIHMEYYIFANDEIGRKLVNLLKKKAKA